VFEELSDAMSSLSFISSMASLDELEVMQDKAVETNGREEEKECEIMEIASNEKNTKAVTLAESLVMKDDIISRFNLEGQGNLYVNSETILYSQALNALMAQYPQFDINTYKSSPINLNGLLDKATEQQFDTGLEEYKAKMGLGEEDGYDSDSHATRSTCIEQSLIGENKSQKAASPLYSVNGDLYEEDKLQQKTQKKEAGQKKQRKQKKEKASKGKGKKGRSAHLQLDNNPGHLNVEQGDYTLQGLRYQQVTLSEDSYLAKKFADVDSLQVNRNISRASTDVDSIMSEDNFNSICPSLLAVIPSLNSQSNRRRVPALVPVWTPENIQEAKIEEFLQNLAEIIENPVTNQERALKLLKSCNMNAQAALEAVEENIPMYRELFKIKPRRQRIRVFG